MSYVIQMHEDLGGDRSVVGRRTGVLLADTISEAADKVAAEGATDVAAWMRRWETKLPEWAAEYDTYYCGAQQVADGTYTRFDLQVAS